MKSELEQEVFKAFKAWEHSGNPVKGISGVLAANAGFNAGARWQAARQQAVPFQSGVAEWMMECFGPQIASDKTERNHRFLEEALELVQACGCTDEEAHKLVDYVFGREIGERSQEVGGVMVTLAALCLAQDLDMQACAETELARITQPETVLKIREKQKRKPAMSPLPGSYPERTALAAAPQPSDRVLWYRGRDEIPPAPDVSGLLSALEAIAHPIPYLQREAEKEGGKLDGGASVYLIQDTTFHRDIARAAIQARQNREG
tara:strand:- start:7400 stop:8185 length:786 start_codon:yes stop_codon:yes gene_type:complete